MLSDTALSLLPSSFMCLSLVFPCQPFTPGTSVLYFSPQSPARKQTLLLCSRAERDGQKKVRQCDVGDPESLLASCPTPLCDLRHDVPFPLCVLASLPIKGRDQSCWPPRFFLPSSPSLPFLASMSQNFSHFKTPSPWPHSIIIFWGGSALAGDPQRFTCSSRAVTASQSAGVASGPLELQSSTHRTDSHWCFQGNWEIGRGQWWRCVQLLHKGLGPESRGEWAMRGEDREWDRERERESKWVIHPPLIPIPTHFVGKSRMGRGRPWKIQVVFDRMSRSMIITIITCVSWWGMTVTEECFHGAGCALTLGYKTVIKKAITRQLQKEKDTSTT